jgi:hypothetical protein
MQTYLLVKVPVHVVTIRLLKVSGDGGQIRIRLKVSQEMPAHPSGKGRLKGKNG